jgi:hypothetical protein
LGEKSAFAVEAFAARDVMKAHHAVARLPFGDAAAHGDDRAGEFVAENLWRRDIGVEDFLDVRTADAASSDFNEYFTVAHFGDRNFFNPDDSLFAVHTCAHGLGDGAERP